MARAADQLLGGQPKGSGDRVWLDARPIEASAAGNDGSAHPRLPESRRHYPFPVGFPAQKVPLMIPANTVMTLLLDQTCLTNAYPDAQLQ